MSKENCPYGYYDCGSLVTRERPFSGERDGLMPQTPGRFVNHRPVGEYRMEGTDMVLDVMAFCCQECADKVLPIT